MFKIGDKVFASDWCEGIIVDINEEENYASVEFETSGGGGCLLFNFNELQIIPEAIAKINISKSTHSTINVIIQNCSSEVVTLLHRFDIWENNGKFEYDENKTNERPKIHFECPLEFLDFIKSDMGKNCFKRMGVEEFYIEE